jgi:N-methylhydantoinase B
MRRSAPDPAEIAVVSHALHSVAVEMGSALRRTAFSPNIKERRDYSSAVFSAEGDLIAMGDDMPAHPGSGYRSSRTRARCGRSATRSRNSTGCAPG